MTLTLQAERVPLRITVDGAAMIEQTRIPLETVITAFKHGDSPEQIVDSFDALTLAQVYAVIAYFLNHRDSVEDYIRRRAGSAAHVQQEIADNRPEMFSLRARLLAKKQQQS